MKDNTVYIINRPLDLKGQTIILPQNSTLYFTSRGSIKNGELLGNGTKIKYVTPFIGERVLFKDCTIDSKSTIRDRDVFIYVSHCQYEIQTLFDISGGNRVEFSFGIYNNIDKIIINNSVDAHFNNSVLYLKYGQDYLGECFYMSPLLDKGIEYVRINDVRIIGKYEGKYTGSSSRRCIQLFYVSQVLLNNVDIDGYNGGPNEYKSDSSDLLDKSRIGTCAIAIMYYDRCSIINCRTNDITKEVFWCVPNTNPDNITYFINNTSTCSLKNGSSSFFTIVDGKCVVKKNNVYNYNGSAFNAFCYDSEISHNSFYNGKRSVAIDLSEGTMYRAKNVYIYGNICKDSKGFIAAFGENIRIKMNKWVNTIAHIAERCTIVTISSRGPRTEDGRYIGCDNNPEKGAGSKDILIMNNTFNCSFLENEAEIRGARLSGDNIRFVNNTMYGLNVPVVQIVDGESISYSGNRIKRTQEGNYGELLMNNVRDIEITNNSFSRYNSANGQNYVVQILKARGMIKYNHNRLNNKPRSLVLSGSYIPCFIKDYSELNRAEIILSREDRIHNAELGLNNQVLPVIKTNIKTKK